MAPLQNRDLNVAYDDIRLARNCALSPGGNYAMGLGFAAAALYIKHFVESDPKLELCQSILAVAAVALTAVGTYRL